MICSLDLAIAVSGQTQFIGMVTAAITTEQLHRRGSRNVSEPCVGFSCLATADAVTIVDRTTANAAMHTPSPADTAVVEDNKPE